MYTESVFFKLKKNKKSFSDKDVAVLHNFKTEVNLFKNNRILKGKHFFTPLASLSTP